MGIDPALQGLGMNFFPTGGPARFMAENNIPPSSHGRSSRNLRGASAYIKRDPLNKSSSGGSPDSPLRRLES
jgi:hypothetical protein